MKVAVAILAMMICGYSHGGIFSNDYSIVDSNTCVGGHCKLRIKNAVVEPAAVPSYVSCESCSEINNPCEETKVINNSCCFKNKCKNYSRTRCKTRCSGCR